MDIYERLARKLDGVPNGFPRTETGVELKILRKIFHPEEAEVVIKMTLSPETAAKIAERLGKPVEGMKEFLDSMVRKGQIGTVNVNGERRYLVIPFIVGIYDSQRNRMDKEFAEMFEEYYPALMGTAAAFPPAVGRVVPVDVNIEAEVKIHRSDEVRQLIEEAGAINRRKCVCKRTKALLGRPCKHENAERYCLVVSKDPNAFEGPISEVMGENISKEEALKVLADAEKAGLVHLSDNVIMHNRIPICACCDCCCDVLRSMKILGQPHFLAKSDFVAQIDQDSCTACGVCKDERCPMDAIAEDNGCYTVIGERCIGCGVCTLTCPTKAIKLEQKSESAEKSMDLMDWYARRAKNRGIEFPS